MLAFLLACSNIFRYCAITNCDKNAYTVSARINSPFLSKKCRKLFMLRESEGFGITTAAFDFQQALITGHPARPMFKCSPELQGSILRSNG